MVQTPLSQLKLRHFSLKKGEASIKTGYTLIEIVVVVASVGMIMVAVVGMILGTFRTQNKTESNDKIMENGSWIISELRKNIFNSYGDDLVCSEDGLSVQVKSLDDGQITTLSCNEGASKIASNSAIRESVLNNNEVEVTDCTDFVVCESDGEKISGVTFNFTLEATTKGVGSTQSFTTKVTLRN